MESNDKDTEADQHPIVQIIGTMTKKFRERVKELKVGANGGGRLVADFEPFLPVIQKQDYILSVNDTNGRIMTSEEIHAAIEQTQIGVFF